MYKNLNIKQRKENIILRVVFFFLRFPFLAMILFNLFSFIYVVIAGTYFNKRIDLHIKESYNLTPYVVFFFWGLFERYFKRYNDNLSSFQWLYHNLYFNREMNYLWFKKAPNFGGGASKFLNTIASQIIKFVNSVEKPEIKSKEIEKDENLDPK